MGVTDVVVVGGGAIGQAIAWRVAEAGRSVVVVDPEPGRGASWAAAGMLAPVAEATFREEPLLLANLAAHARWPAFAAALEEASGRRTGYHECGTVLVARDQDDLGELDRLHDFRQQLGLAVERMRGRELRRLEPALATSVRGGLHSPDDHQVDNRAVLDALAVAGARAGVRTRASRVERILRVGGRVAGVGLDDGAEIAAPVVVVAAGAGTARIEGFPDGAAPPLRPVKGQLLQLRVPEGEPPLTRRTVRGLEVYVVSRGDGRTVVGATMEEQGFDRRVTAGAVYELLRAAYELLPGIVECELRETVTGLRPGSPDNAPIIGAWPGLEGLVVAAGHYRNGLLLTPLTADGVVQLLDHGTVPGELAALAPGRFVTEGAVS